MTESHFLDAPTDGRRATAATTPAAQRRAERPLRILIPSYRSAPHTGGQGIYVQNLSRALADLGHHVDVASGPPYPELDPRVGLIRLPSLDLFSEKNAFKALKWKHLLSRPDAYEWWAHNTGAFAEPATFGMRLARHVTALPQPYDLVHDNQSLSWGLLQIARRGTPVVATLHHPITRDRDVALGEAKDWGTRALLRRWYGFLRMQAEVARALPALIAVSQSTRRDAATDFGLDPARMTVIHNGVDTTTFRPLPEVPRRNDLMVATVSANTPLKGLAYLPPAFSGVAQRQPQLKLEIVAKPPAADILTQNASGTARARIRFRPGLSQTDLVRLYAEATVAVAPSLYEGFGLPAAEAMACGVPVIATSGGALPEVVGDAGMIVPAADAAALADAISALLDDPAQRLALGARGLLRATSQFRWDQNAKACVAIYRRILGGC